MKLCRCPALHADHNGLPQSDRRYCNGCGVSWDEMREPKPDAFGRFMDGSVVIHWLDGSVNLVDVGGEKLLARRYFTGA